MLLQLISLAETLPDPPGRSASFLRGLVLLLLILGLSGWYGFTRLKRSEDPARLVFKWGISLPIFGVLIFIVAPMLAKGGYEGAFGGVPFAAVCGLALALIWRDNLSSIVANAFGNLYDGGNTPPEPQPFYSAAMAKRKRGQYGEALADIHQQLERFPQDYEGQFMIASILAENLNDLHGADMAIQRLCHQPGHPSGSLVMALNALVDWRLKYAQDRDGAREALERILTLFPETEYAARAAQRIAHLASTEQMLAPYDRIAMVVRPGVQNMGLLPVEQQVKAPEVDPSRQMADYVAQLGAHPLDTEAREKLAVLYARDLGRPDLAADQLEQLITLPNQPVARVVHWLNLLADLQAQHGGTFETVCATLQRIVDLFPGHPGATLAGSRIAHLKLEMRGKERSQTVKLGSYEQDIGLKRDSFNR